MTEALITEIINGKQLTFEVVFGDITEQNVDAIVTPTNPDFRYAGSGVQEAIFHTAGSKPFNEAFSKARVAINEGIGIEESDDGYKSLSLGFAITTTAGNFQNVRRIIHVNNMRYDENDEPSCDVEVVRLAVTSCLAEADRANLKSIAFPAMGTGLWGMDLGDSMNGTIEGIKDYLKINPNTTIEKVEFVIFTDPPVEDGIEIGSIVSKIIVPD